MRANRLFPTENHGHMDPFVLCERFHIGADQGFDTHPHRGFEILSYMLEGEMEHEDSMGNASVVGPGDAMRVTTGRGMEHSELPAGPCSGLQLWVNLPREAKDTDPGHGEATAGELPTEERPDATVTTVVGEGSPLELHTPVRYEDARLREWTWAVPEGWVGFCYAVSGEGIADGEPFGAGDFLVSRGESATLEAGGRGEALRVLAVSGEPHGERIDQRGPYVL
jgi:redox-sensitive bicupin YhaK (pirin superfamily)